MKSENFHEDVETVDYSVQRHHTFLGMTGVAMNLMSAKRLTLLIPENL